jgi:hypothetical protein
MNIKNLKPSELPPCTVIGNYSDGLWFKSGDIEWVAIAPIGIKLQISDLGYPPPHNAEYVTEKSDLYFKDYDVVSLPVGWAPAEPKGFWQVTVALWRELFGRGKV